MGYGISSTGFPSGSATGSQNSGYTLQSADVTLKDWYYNRNQLNAQMYNSPILARVQRFAATQYIEGKGMIVPVRIGTSPNSSKDFEKAQERAKKKTAAFGRFEVPTDYDFHVGRVSNEVIKASRSDMGSFVRAIVKSTDLAIEALRLRRCGALFAPEYDTSGVTKNPSAKLQSTDGTKKILTLGDKSQAVNFTPGDEIEVYAPTASAPRQAKVTVTSVSISKGQITVNTAIAAGAANDLIIKEGDYNQRGMASFPLWLPRQTSANDFVDGNKVLFGLDRSIARERLAGWFQDVADAASSKSPIMFAVSQMLSNISLINTDLPTAFYCNSRLIPFIKAEQSSNLRLDMSNGGTMRLTRIGVGRVAFETEQGLAEIIGDPFCPIEDCFLINERHWGIQYLGGPGDDFVDFAWSENGRILNQSHDASGQEVRCESYGNLTCDNPGSSGRLRLASALVNRATGAPGGFNA